MAGKENLTELSLRKQALIVESELNRLTLRVEIDQLRAAAAGIGRGAKAGGWLSLLAPLAGIWFMRRFRRRESAPDRTTSVLRSLLSLYALWKNFRGKRPENMAKDDHPW